MSSLLTPDFGLLFWMAICFAIVFVLLARFGFPVIVRAVNKRSDYIRNSLEIADEANRRLSSVRMESEMLTSQARHQQAEIIRKALSESEDIVRNAQERATAEAEKQLLSARHRIEAQKKKAMGEISSEVAAMAIEIAEKILREKLDDPGKQQALIVRMLEEAEGSGK